MDGSRSVVAGLALTIALIAPAFTVLTLSVPARPEEVDGQGRDRMTRFLFISKPERR